MRRTSLSHPVQIATVETLPGCGRIGVTFCPGKKDSNAMTGGWDRDLGLDLDAIVEWGAAVVVTLVEPFELEELKVPHIGEEVAHRHMDWLHLPIRDVSTPGEVFEAAWASAGPALHARLRDGQNVLVHCKGGLGRAGTIAARLLVELGKAPNEAIARVRAVRPGALETKAQEAYVAQCAPFAAPAPLASPDALEDRAIGALIGLAVGDAVGTTLEFRPRNDKAERHPQMMGGGPFRLKAGQWTDAPAMALALADSLTANPALDPRDLMRRFVQWWQQGTYSCTGKCFDIGDTTRQAIQKWLKTGDPLAGSPAPHTAGNGSLMRLAPVAIRHWRDAEARHAVAALQSRTTHGAPEAVDACILFADMIAEAIAGRARAEILAPRTFAGAPRITALAAGEWRGKPRKAIKGSGYVVDALEASLWCIARTADFSSAVLMAANLRDDADTTAAITGQLAGALYGASGIPERWRDTLAWCPRIANMAGALFRDANKH